MKTGSVCFDQTEVAQWTKNVMGTVDLQGTDAGSTVNAAGTNLPARAFHNGFGCYRSANDALRRCTRRGNASFRPTGACKLSQVVSESARRSERVSLPSR